MPSQVGLSYKREAVRDRLRSARYRLRSRGVDIGGDDPRRPRDPQARELQELGETADLLEAVVVRLDEVLAQVDLDAVATISALGAEIAELRQTQVTVSVDGMLIEGQEIEVPGIEEIAAAAIADYELDERAPGPIDGDLLLEKIAALLPELPEIVGDLIDPGEIDDATITELEAPAPEQPPDPPVAQPAKGAKKGSAK